ncbi:hypothetical protein [Nocardia sp. NBC_00511]|uniref:hypothetical protein n=1 Tax=Nocardia sp. NBC_00511 TaxID=2903591 RepID=UPI0030E048AC
MIKPLTLLTTFVMAAGGLGVGTVADSRIDTTPVHLEAAASCLWAGGAHPQGEQIAAGGTTYTCGSDSAGPRWFPGGAAGVSTVPNPGANANPAGLFSAGARQPGTDYDDYCSGDQLIPGVGDQFEAVPTSGGLLWKSAGPITRWSFDPGVVWPHDSTRSTGLCSDGQLL